MYDPKTGKYTAYQTCFGSHHLQFGYDANEMLWMSSGSGGGNVGWINTKMLPLRCFASRSISTRPTSRREAQNASAGNSIVLAAPA